MRRIRRKTLMADFFGNVISAKAEELVDHEDGTIEETSLTTHSRCEACGRPLEKMSETRGSCILCGRACCALCAGSCAVCGSGPFCGRCRTGFAERGLSVCSYCLPALKQRLAYQDQLIEEKIAFEKNIALCTAQLRFAQILQHHKGRFMRTLARFAEFKVSRKIASLERELNKENGHGRLRLP